jgi:DNA-binding NtrC family response regulator
LPFSSPRLESGIRPAVLLVEDEPTLSHVLARILTDEGYDVTVRANGLDALAVVTDAETRIDVVVSDVGLPGLRGDKLAAELRRIRPVLPVVLMTGFSAVVVPGSEGALGVAAVLEKPVAIEDLLAALRDALATFCHLATGRGQQRRYSLA